MTQVTELEPVQITQAAAAVSDRRRPGRVGNVSPELIPILRGQEPELALDFDEADQTSAIRGVFFGVLLSAPVWVGIAYLGSLVLSK